jgi:PAS domain S-box-containing protein
MRGSRYKIIIISAFILLLITNFLNEVLDLPYLIFGTQPTPINWTELSIEMIFLFLVGLISIHFLYVFESKHRGAELKMDSALKSLSESEEQYHGIFNSATDSFLIFDFKGKIVEANPQACKMYGYSPDELIKLSGRDIVHPDYFHLFEQFKKDVQATGEFHAESVDVRQDGTSFNIEVRGTTLDLRGKPHLLAVIRDITDRKRSEECARIHAMQQDESAKFGKLAMSDISTDELMDEAVILISRVLDTKYSKVLEHLPNKKKLFLKAGVGWKKGWVGRLIMSDGVQSQGGYSLLCDNPVISEDIVHEKRFSPPPLLTEHDAASGLTVVIPGKERPFGVLGVHTDKKRHFSSDDANFIQTIANVLADAIELRREKEGLKQSEEKLRSILNGMTDYCYIVSKDHKIEFMNKAMMERFGDQTGNTCYKSMFGRESPCPWSKLGKVQKGETVKWEYYFSDLKGTFEIIDCPLLTKDGAIVKLGIWRDISERKRADKALRESEKKLSQIIEGSSTPIFVIDKNHTVTHWNKACENLTGFSAGEMVGTKKQWTPFYSTERPVLADVIVDNLTEEGIAKYYHNKFQKSALIDGAYEVEDFFSIFGNKWLFFTAAPLRDHQGKVIGAIETLKDITERKKTEKTLKQKLLVLSQPAGEIIVLNLNDIIDIDILQELQDSFSETYDVASLMFDNEGKPITKPSNFSDFCKIIRTTKIGREKCEISDANLSKLVINGSSAIVSCCNFKEIQEAAVPLFIGYKHIATWGIGQKVISKLSEDKVRSYAKEIGVDDDKLIAASKKLMTGSKERFRRAVNFLEVIAKDISLLGSQNIQQAREINKRMLAEEKLQKAHDELEIRVKERTADLQTANKELEAFSYSVSHDLRAPLRAIDGFSQILLEDYLNVLDEEGQRYLQRVRAGTQNMGQLIDDLLQLSRIGRQPMVKETIKLENIAKETHKSLKNEWKGRKVNFSVHQCQATQVDPRLMQIVFTNLLSNALKFTRNKKAAKIEFGCKSKNKQTHFYVKDNGVGFDMKYADKLFSPFQRLHRAEDYEGTGIGLAIVQRIIHRHKGRIWAESEVGKGTVFYFTLDG